MIEDGRGHDGGDDAGQDGLEFELRFPVEHLRGEERRPQGRVKDGPDAAGGSGQHQDAPVPGFELQNGGQERPETRADLGNGTFFAGGTAAADGNGGSQNLHQRHPFANIAALAVKGLDHGIGAVALGFRRDEKDQEPRDQTTQGRNHQKQPGAGRPQDGHGRGSRPSYRFHKARGQVQKMIKGIAQ